MSKFSYLASRFIVPGAAKCDGLRLVFDAEADALVNEATRVHCIVGDDLDSDQISEYGPTEIAAALDHLARADYLIGHNLLDYDLPLLRKLYNLTPSAGCTIADTLIIARTILPHVADLDNQAAAMGDAKLGKLSGRYSLEAWGARLGMPKVGADIEDWTAWTPEMQARCVGDVALTKALWKFLQPDGYSQAALALEHRVAAICDQIGAAGVPFDADAAERLRAQWTARRAELKAQLAQQFPGVNLNSRPQIGALLEARGWKPETYTEKTQRPRITDEVLESLAAQFPEFTGLAEFMILGRRLAQLSSGARAWIKSVGADGRIHGRIVHIGTPHSRAKHLQPNLAQVPNPKRGKPFASECRALFRAPDDWVFVTSDQASLQDRGFAHYLAAFDGGAYAKAFLDGADPHWHAALTLGLIPQGAVRDKNNAAYEVIREGAKSFRYAFLYGAGMTTAGRIIANTIRAVQRLDANTDLPRRFFGKSPQPSEAALTQIGKKALSAFEAGTPGLQQLRESLKAHVNRHGWLPGLDGRRVPVRALYTALNFIVTSAEAIICKRWLVNVYDELAARFSYGNDVAIVLWVHDEIGCIAKPEIAEQIGEILVRHAREAGKFYDFKVALDADYKIGRSWAGEPLDDVTAMPTPVTIPSDLSIPSFLNRTGGAPIPPPDINALIADDLTVVPIFDAPPLVPTMNDVTVDREQLQLFIDALFLHATAGTFISLRTFFEGEDTKSFDITAVKLNGNLGVLVDQAYRAATRAAAAPERLVFCPPTATFTNANRARETDLAEGLTLSVECDKQAQAARTEIERLLGPATVVVASGGTWTNENGQPEPKLHLHYRLKQPPRDRAGFAKLKRARKLLAAMVGADPTNVPLVHPIRWPGSVHRKGAAKLCQIVAYNADVEIELDAALAIPQASLPGDKPIVYDGFAGYSEAGAQRDPNWNDLIHRVLTGESYHDPLNRLAIKLLLSGTHDGAVVNLLRGWMEAAVPHDARDVRWQTRFDDIPRAVTTAREKIGNNARAAFTSTTALRSVSAANVTMTAVDWLWPNRFGLSKLGLIVGLPDEGKGLLISYIAAQVTNGGAWPSNEGCAVQGNVLLFTAEDDPSDTVVPRLAAAGADLSRITIISMVHEEAADRMFSLQTDLEMLRRKIVEIGNVVLILIDPISAYLGVGKMDSYRTTDVRAVLGPVVNLAAEFQLAIIGIMHFNKKIDITNALLRISDSLAYGATARHVYGVINDPENHRKLVVRAKNNLARNTAEQMTLAFSFGEREVGTDPNSGKTIVAPYVIWEPQYVDVTATEAMQAAAEHKSPGARDKAKQFLIAFLSAGPVPVKDIEEAAAAELISKRTLERAKDELHIIVDKDRSTPGGKWFWKLPQ